MRIWLLRGKKWEKSPGVVQYARRASKCYHLESLSQKKRTQRVLSNTTWSVTSVLSPFFESNWYFAHITVPPITSNLSSLFHHLMTHELISVLNRGCPFFLPQLCLIDKTKASFISLNRAVTNKIKVSEQEKALLKRRSCKKESTESQGLEKWVKLLLGRKGSYVFWLSLDLGQRRERICICQPSHLSTDV